MYFMVMVYNVIILKCFNYITIIMLTSNPWSLIINLKILAK
jgi:hypothetical protein